MKDVSSTSLIAGHFKTNDMKAFFYQNFTAQFRGSQSEVQFTTNTNPIGRATILNIFPPPNRGKRGISWTQYPFNSRFIFAL